MQRRKGHSRGWSSLRKITNHPAFACFTVVFFGLSPLTSCSTQNTKNLRLTTESLRTELSRICLSAEGKARLEYGKNKYLFNFESLLKREENSWLIAAHIPLHGEELMGVNYADGKSAKIIGSFLSKMREQAEIDLKKKKQALSTLDFQIAFLKLGQVLYFIAAEKALPDTLKKLCSSDTDNLNCQPYLNAEEKIHLKFKEKSLIIEQDLPMDRKLVMEFSDLGAKYYEKIHLFFNQDRQKFEMIFFINECTQS